MKSIIPLLLLFGINSFAQHTNYIKNIQIHPSLCSEENGYIHFTKQCSYCTYYWDDHDESGNRDNLKGGTYYLNAEDYRGCVERIPLNVPSIENCELYLNFLDVPNHCAKVEFEFYKDGVLIPSNQIINTWFLNGNYSGNQDFVYIDNSPTNIELNAKLTNAYNIPCCEYKMTHHYQGLCTGEGGPRDDKRIWVHRAQFRSGVQKENIIPMLELLVVGDRACGVTDLRGLIIDDNDGILIKSENSLYNNMEDLGISPGYISFTNDVNWSAVPNGSTITLFDGTNPLCSSLLLNQDPTDSDSDFNYLLSIDNPTYFQGYETTWSNGQLNYTNIPINPSWGLIELRDDLSAVQVKNEYAEYIHGFSFGSNSNTSTTNEFLLYLTAQSSASAQVQMNKLSIDQKSDYQIIPNSNGFTVNEFTSPEMIGLIDTLRNCLGQESIIARSISKPKNTLDAFPNPFNNITRLVINSDQLGRGKVKIYNSVGKLIRSENFMVDTFDLEYDLKVNNSGLLLVEVEFPDGYKQILKIINITH